MIELGKKTPSFLMAERIAIALQLDPPELFSMRNVPPLSLKKLRTKVLTDIDKAISSILSKHLNEIAREEEKPIQAKKDSC
jgi:hypothetical protein